jgi:hypothetical protein
MIAHTGKILDPTAPDEDNGMFLKVMTHAGNIGGYFVSAGQADPGDLPQSGIRFLGR